MFAVKKNQGTLYEDISQYFENEAYREKEKQKGNYIQTIEKTHGRVEIRNYYVILDRYQRV